MAKNDNNILITTELIINKILTKILNQFERKSFIENNCFLINYFKKKLLTFSFLKRNKVRSFYIS